MEPTTQIVSAELPNGKIVQIQATNLGGERPVDFSLPSFSGVIDTIDGIAQSMDTTLKKAKPTRASVEFGVEVALESGQLTALLVKGTADCTLKITLEWSEGATSES